MFHLKVITLNFNLCRVGLVYYNGYYLLVITMVLKTGTVKEPEKYLIIGFMVEPRSDRWSNR